MLYFGVLPATHALLHLLHVLYGWTSDRPVWASWNCTCKCLKGFSGEDDQGSIVGIEWHCSQGLLMLTCVCLSVCWHMWDIYFASPLSEKLKGASIFAHVCVLYDELSKPQGLIHLSHASLGNARSLIKDWIFHDKFAILLATCSHSLFLSLSPRLSFSSPLSPPVPPLPSGSLFHIISHFQSCTYSAGSLHVSRMRIIWSINKR